VNVAQSQSLLRHRFIGVHVISAGGFKGGVSIYGSKLALQFNVAGYVRNLPDGRVELVMEGPEPEMEHLVDSIRQKMNGYIRNVDRQIYPATGEFNRFSIRH